MNAIYLLNQFHTLCMFEWSCCTLSIPSHVQPSLDHFKSSRTPLLTQYRTSFHIDHAAGLPYVLSKTNFRGRIFMTHATKAIYKWLIQDSVRVG